MLYSLTQYEDRLTGQCGPVLSGTFCVPAPLKPSR